MTPTPIPTPPRQSLALVIGAGGGLGAALVQQLSADGQHQVVALGRNTQPAIDYTDEASLRTAAEWVAEQCAALQADLRLLVVASGFLHGEQGQPERSWSHLDAAIRNSTVWVCAKLLRSTCSSSAMASSLRA